MDKKITVTKWLDRLTESLHNNSLKTPLGEPMPQFPPEQLQVDTTGLGGAAALAQAAAFYADLVDTADRLERPLGEESRILDFGSGWGRITRFFLRDTRHDNIVGLEVDPGFVEISNHLFGGANFQVCNPQPPTPFATGSFDVVSAYSVFSHLSEETSRQWVDEFARLLKPGGLFIFTTRNEAFLDTCRQLSLMGNLNHHQSILAGMFDNWEDARRQFRSGQFLHRGLGGGGVRDASYYGESFIPRAYIEREYGENFEIVFASGETAQGPARHGLAGRRAEYDQACFVLRRRG